MGVSFESTEGFDALVAHYAQAIPAAGYEVIDERSDFPGMHEWLFNAGESFQPFVSVNGTPGGGGTSTVGLGLLGIPPEC